MKYARSRNPSPPFEGLDFVYEALHCAGGDAVLEVAEKSSAVGPENLADPFERLDSRVHGVSAPRGKELLALFADFLLPE